jgi:hypothetical protein
MDGWMIVSTLDKEETEDRLYGKNQRLFRRLRYATDIMDKLNHWAKGEDWDGERPVYGIEPVTIKE